MEEVSGTSTVLTALLALCVFAAAAPPAGLEPATRCLEGSRSVHLSYRGGACRKRGGKPKRGPRSTRLPRVHRTGEASCIAAGALDRRNPSRGAPEPEWCSAHNPARWTSRLGAGVSLIATDTLRRRYLRTPGRLTHSARRFTLHLPQRWPWAERFNDSLANLCAVVLVT